ncbi:MAG: dihydroxy-acid dehydratase [Bryobacteraceae bacterium]|nr:dihydroxy-acid dehydratase [Bryobacteraceae bacterium]
MKRELRSSRWFFENEYYAFARRAYLRSEGLNADIFEDKPVIGICNSWSELNHCNRHLREVAEAVKRGVWKAGGVPLEFPTISLGEPFVKPTAMLLRNLMAMDVEECIRGYPMDGVVLLCGCDKTTPAQLMGAASADLPAIVVPGGPALSSVWKNRKLGSGTDGRKLYDLHRIGEVGDEEWCEIEGAIARSAGHCMVMGTASTMTSIAEALGMTLPGCASIPAPDSRRLAIAERSGRRIVEMVSEDLRPSRIMSREAFENAIVVDMALGGSTNAVVHLIAIAGRLGIRLALDDFDRLSRRSPYITNVKPSGEFLMEDFFYAGGLPVVMREALPLLHGACLTVNGRTIAENVASAECHNRAVIRTLDAPLHPEGGTAILYGNLCPDGAVIKPTAASPHLLVHRGKAFVFDRYEQMKQQVESEDLPVDEHSVLVMKNAGPKGGPGFPEWGHMPMPKVLLKRGVTDVVRISDARMSGTSFGTVVLHVAPESAIGGPLAVVETGDEIELDAPNRRLNLRVPAAEIERRLAAFTPPPPHYDRGYGRLFLEHVTQANLGCDFDFLTLASALGRSRVESGQPPSPAVP